MIRFTEDNTQDDEFRIIGHGKAMKGPSSTPNKVWKYKTLWTVLAILFIATLIITWSFWTSRTPQSQEEAIVEYFEPDNSVVKSTTNLDVVPLSTVENIWSSDSFTESLTKNINDIELNIYIPHGGYPSLMIGIPDITDKSIIFAAQAADIRADNGKINGAFVLGGEPIAWGLSKKGFCSIINDSIAIGTSTSSPLFEKATEEGGYFFRQYSLVNNGTLTENEPKGKSIRKALCDRNGEIFIAISATPESFHDFSQALVDLGVENAIYLVGSEDSYGFYRDKDGNLTELTIKKRSGQLNENYIIWKEYP